MKMEGFWRLGTTFGVILSAYFTLSSFLKKLEKSMPKGNPQIVFFDEKWSLGRPRFDLFSHFCCFWWIEKSVIFWYRTGPSKIGKNDSGAAKRNQPGPRTWPKNLLWPAGVPRAAPRATRKVERGHWQEANRPEGKKASGKIWKRKQLKGKIGTKERKRDLTRQWARGPSNFWKPF